ncbi:hypothetical protein SORBI_3004G137300 [Sorghum bicolor]|uniref:Uncharacterized protein n=1 Tax=Sorghum bicolor TaxID=4558 RepID=A0A194YPL9_SORBI|nr:hypothetical protein SORBI_3004G137300 [Sorghum bicolor]
MASPRGTTPMAEGLLKSVEHNLGFPASAAEIRRFRPWSRKVVKARPQIVDERSFAAAVKQGEMDRGREGVYREQSDSRLRLGGRTGSGRYADGRDWRGDDERGNQDSFNKGEDRFHFNPQRGDVRSGSGG